MSTSSGSVGRFEELAVWKRARVLTRLIYKVTSSGSFARDFPLRDQIRRATISIMSNIAEGFERGGDKEFLFFLSAAKGSCGEVRSQLQTARDLEYASPSDLQELTLLALETSCMLAGLMKYLESSPLRGSKYRHQPSA